MTHTEPAPDGPRPFDATPCAVSAYGVVRVPFDGIAALRKAPGPRPPGVEKVPLSLLKHADHQTLLALAAVLRAAADFGLDGPFRDWGVIAAPRFLGRIGTAGALFRFTQTGASGVSPLIIPTMSLHAVAGSLSMALKAHGFNYGVGGGPGHLAEAWLAGLAACREPGVEGVWVVATGFDPEPIPGISGDVLAATTGYGVALALSPAPPAEAGRWRWAARLLTAPEPAPSGPASDAHGGEPLTPLIELADFLDAAGAARSPRRWHCPIQGVGSLVLDDDPRRAHARGDARRAG